MVLLQFIDAKIAGYEHNRPGRAKIYGLLQACSTGQNQSLAQLCATMFISMVLTTVKLFL